MATGYVANQTTVYYGPSTTIYPSNGSYAGPAETVDVLWREGNWYYIEYSSGSYRKRMYIPKNSVTNISGSVSTYTPNLVAKVCGKGLSTYNGPSNTTYATAGSVGNYESVYYLSNKKTNGYALIEYDISGGQKKRAWYPYNELGIKKGVDTYAKLTQPLANAIAAAGYSFVGRYYYSDASGPVTGPFDLLELSYLHNAGLDVFIYFENGSNSNSSYYTAAQGVADATFAYDYAKNTIGQPAGTTIYFAVELEATASQISGCITTYLNAVHSTLLSLGTAANYQYNAGLYSFGYILSGLAVSGFVSRVVAYGGTGSSSYRGWDNRQIATNGDYEIQISNTKFNVVVSKLQHAGGWSC